MSARVLLPWTDIDVPEGLGAAYYDGGVPPADLGDVEFYVLPYDRGPEPPKLIKELPSLRVVQSLSAGVETLVPLLPEGVRLANGRGLHDLSVAEHALALIHAAQRDLPRWFAQQTRGEWSREHTRSLADSRVLLVGYGSIGQAVERQLVAAEAVVTRVASRPRPDEGVHGVAELPALLPEADIVVLVLPDTPATRGLIGPAELAALPDDALVINVGRGTAIDTDALLAETRTGRLRAGLDVVDPEPLPADHPLWTVPGVVITPHIAGGSASFYPRAKKLAGEQLRRYAQGEELLNLVVQ
ncbi:dehydrogenase [Amycolatopsis mediterranei S699]|uniref:Dehydrogenase n=2 Tax=Amycolatopsis mediterranei TaxID=33910 RepID=A0A9R0NTZ4_AMYMS|nr:2-hydroxyacid dehydrogenase [Amycolatopsis mediterranei]ADJ43879.1 putative dehydrogenase [Amycolatopsis mediterranei U32]AEK40596.1 dehydrogenase [Amycolatopsis mediterranei S699]AFO75591.1 dehydrogenase [Amycolatopsis mediterranei S699]AGT82720.1 dehydrogenase [Amycolatopsis mediterranei RB]KDO09115.1 dihydrofolate reductase [Amycolatopsis mediterranei]